MNITIFIIVAVASLLLVKAETDPGVLNLINMGHVEGKNYFRESGDIQRNWTSAGNYCKESGMELATIETQAQADFLRSKYGYGVFYGVYWTAARDSHLAREFTWNTTGTVPSEISGLRWSTDAFRIEYQTCVMYYAKSSPTLELYPCALTTSFVLCQT